MAQEQKKVETGRVWQELLQFGLYKRSQGRITRQVTFAVLAVGAAIGMWRLGELLGPEPLQRVVVPLVLWTVAALASYKVVNYPKFADFLIAVEAEMNKVSWPSRTELFRASLVVLFTIFFMAAVLFGFDFVWNFVFEFLGVRGGGFGGG